jgi:hypothetical protein
VRSAIRSISSFFVIVAISYLIFRKEQLGNWISFILKKPHHNKFTLFICPPNHRTSLQGIKRHNLLYNKDFYTASNFIKKNFRFPKKNETASSPHKKYCTAEYNKNIPVLTFGLEDCLFVIFEVSSYRRFFAKKDARVE